MIKGAANCQNRIRSVLSGLLLAIFFSVLVGSISPQLHKAVHSEANNTDHTCAITLISSGTGVELCSNTVFIGIVSGYMDDCTIQQDSVLSTFQIGSTYEHAPPAHV